MKYPRDRVNFHTITGRGTWLTRHQDLTRYKATAKAVWYCTGIEKLINWRNYNIQKHTHAYMELWYFIRWLLKINGELIAARTIVHADRKKRRAWTLSNRWSSLIIPSFTSLLPQMSFPVNHNIIYPAAQPTNLETILASFYPPNTIM